MSGEKGHSLHTRGAAGVEGTLFTRIEGGGALIRRTINARVLALPTSRTD